MNSISTGELIAFSTAILSTLVLLQVLWVEFTRMDELARLMALILAIVLPAIAVGLVLGVTSLLVAALVTLIFAVLIFGLWVGVGVQDEAWRR
ncbi:MAG: hypothetical protein KatS3mg050_1964 [Litorilinea sp.]|nr:MAG: hypothetical protein KatS3mg050_1964 [Litorilinea sp.]